MKGEKFLMLCSMYYAQVVPGDICLMTSLLGKRFMGNFFVGDSMELLKRFIISYVES
jgi:hypothetical protein